MFYKLLQENNAGLLKVISNIEDNNLATFDDFGMQQLDNKFVVGPAADYRGLLQAEIRHRDLAVAYCEMVRLHQ